MHASRPLIILLAASMLGGFGDAARAAKPDDRPNVLFIPIDDMNDWVGHLGGHPQTVTPNLDRLADRGVAFSTAYCAAPACNPSRVALLTGLRPSSTGVYHNANPWRPVLPDAVTLPRHFKDHGYFTAGFGKIYHGRYPDPSDWHIWGAAPGDQRKVPGEKHLTNGGVGGIRFGPLANTDEEMIDHLNVTRAIEQINRKHDRPWFIGCGLHKPHMAFSVPKRFFDKFPLESIKLPEVPADDLDDIPPAGIKMAKPAGDHTRIIQSGRWKEAVQAYLATIHFADAELGRLIDALDASPHKDNTIICLWSDHGWHLGEKQHWRKFALWEEATRAPMIFVVPGVTANHGFCRQPVDYMSIYPTLIDLCGLPPRGELEGVSLRPLLTAPDSEWDRPALTTHGKDNHALRSRRFRYIRYADGSEELYDHRVDPMEFNNLAGEPEYNYAKQDLARWFPDKNVPEAPKDSRVRGRGKRKK